MFRTMIAYGVDDNEGLGSNAFLERTVHVL